MHYGINLCRRVSRSVIAAEVQGHLLGFDYAFFSRKLLYEILRRKMDLEAYTDWKTLFNIVAKDEATKERRLQIDFFALRESYEEGEFSRIWWIPGGNKMSRTR